jgi:hypothetical protein
VSARVYVPATLGSLRDLVASGALPASAERLTAADASEEAEYAVLMAAAAGSRALGGGTGRRVVVVAELPAPDGEVPLDRVVAVHVDTEDDADEDDDLAWFATQEIPDLLG